MVAAIVISVAIPSNDGFGLLQQPEIEDRYVMVEKNGELKQWTIRTIETDSISFSSNNAETDHVIYRKYSIEDLEEMKTTEHLVKIIRP
jgi:hypothetical protein